MLFRVFEIAFQARIAQQPLVSEVGLVSRPTISSISTEITYKTAIFQFANLTQILTAKYSVLTFTRNCSRVGH